jgi:hypothetical protein
MRGKKDCFLQRSVLGRISSSQPFVPIQNSLVTMSQPSRHSISLDGESCSARDHLLEGQEGDLKSLQRPRGKAWRACTAHPILLHITLILIYTLIFLYRISTEESPLALFDDEVVPYSRCTYCHTLQISS